MTNNKQMFTKNYAKWILALNRSKKGFTLMELLVVVLIIGILAAVALPQYNKAVEKSRTVEAITIMNSIQKAIDLYVLEHGYQTVELVGLADGESGGKPTGELDIDIESMMDCNSWDGDACASKDFAYNATCMANYSSCHISAFRLKNPVGYNGDNEEYELYMTKRASNGGKWEKKCRPKSDFPYSEKLCRSLEAQGWQYDD